MDPDTRLLIFARAPDPGRCKTRLASSLGDAGAAMLHARLVRRIVQVFSGQDICQTELWCAPDTDHPFFQQLHERYQIPLYPQHHGDLGLKMARAAEQRLQQYSRVIITGTDCPLLDPRHLVNIVDDLRHGFKASIIPAEDGGYVMLGLQSFHPQLFASIPWGSAQVMDQTAARLDTLGWQWKRHQALWDIDREEDYQRLLSLDMVI